MALPSPWKDLNEDEVIEKLEAESPKLSILEELSVSENWEIRKGVALSKFVSEAILEKFSNDDDFSIVRLSRNILKKKDLPHEWRILDDTDTLKKLYGKNIDEKVLKNFAKSDIWQMRRGVVLSESSDESILDLLKDDDDDSVKTAFIERNLPIEWRFLNNRDKARKIRDEFESTSLEILKILSQTKSDPITPRDCYGTEVRHALAVKDNLDEEIINLLKNNIEEEEVALKKIKNTLSLPPKYRFNNNECWNEIDEEKLKEVETENIEKEHLQILSQNDNWQIKLAVAKNPEVSIEILQTLTEDYTADVRNMAKKKLKKLKSK